MATQIDRQRSGSRSGRLAVVGFSVFSCRWQAPRVLLYPGVLGDAPPVMDSDSPSTARDALAALWQSAALPARALADIDLSGADPVLPSSFAVATAVTRSRLCYSDSEPPQ